MADKVAQALALLRKMAPSRVVTDPVERAANLKNFLGPTPEEIATSKWYHGTAREVPNFTNDKPTFVTTNPKFANAFAEQGGIEHDWDDVIKKWVPRPGSEIAPNVMPLHVRAENPWDHTNPDHVQAVLDRLYEYRPLETNSDRMRLMHGDWENIEMPYIQREIKGLGHDAFFVNEGGERNLAVYNPANQLKSATGNAGTFDPDIPRLEESHGGAIDAALHAVRQHFDEGGFLDSLRSLFSGDDYQSTGDKVIKDGEVQWGNPESAADFFRADKARMALDQRPAVGEPGGDVTGSIPAPRPQTRSMPTTIAAPAPAPAPAQEPLFIPYQEPERAMEMPELPKPPAPMPLSNFQTIPGALTPLSSDFVRTEPPAPQAFINRAVSLAQDTERPPVEPLAYTATPAPAPAAQAITAAMPVDGKLTARIPEEPHGTALTKQQADYIVRTIAAETSGKSPEETRAIASVILNRINSGKYGASPEAVLFAKRQFEPWMSRASANYPMKISPTSQRYVDAREALEAAMAGEDITGGATNFWAPKAQYSLGRDTPDWAVRMPDYTDIGATRFHRPNREEGGEVEGYAGGGDVVKKALDAIRGWHGSGRQFKQFDASKMGSGAGELFGRGVYITDTPNFARTYRSMALKGSPEPKIGNVPVSDLYSQFEREAKGLPPQEAKLIYDKMQVLEDMIGEPVDSLALKEILKSSNYHPEAREWFESKVVPKLKTPGGLYEVEIKAKPEQFLQWQKPFGEQSPFIQDALRPKAVEMAERANQARAQMLERGVDYARRPFTPERIEELRKISTPEDIGGLNLYGGIHRDYGSVNPNEWQPEANQFLRDQGVVGNTYRDMAGKGNVQNYVVYDPADTEILNRYAHGGEIHGDKGMNRHDIIAHALNMLREHHANGEAVGPTAQQRLRETIANIDPERSREQPVMDPAMMGAAWQNSLKNLRNFPRQEGEAVARPLELGIRDQIGGAIGGEPRAPGADFRRGIADLLVGSTGLPDSGTLGFGLADAPMLTGVPLTLADMAHDVSQGDYVNAAMNAALPAAFYARGPLGAAGRRAVEIAKDYAKPIAGAAGVAATMTPEDAEAAKLSKALQLARVAVPDFAPRKMTLQEIRRTFDPHAGAGMSGDELERLVNAYGKVATPASLDPELARRGEEIAKGYITKTGSEYGGRSFFGHKPSVPLEELGRVTDNFANSADLQPIVQKPWAQVGRERFDSPMISLGGDLSDLVTLRGYGPKDDMSALATPRNIHAGFKYMRNPNPYIGWANAEEHAAILDKQVKNLQEINRAVKKDLPIMGVSTAMGPQSIDSSRDMVGVLTSAIEGRGIRRKDLDEATNYIRSGAFAEGEKAKANAAALMKDFPGFHDELGAYEFLTSPNIPGTVRGAIIKGLEKKTLVDKGFPEIGQLRYASSDPQFAMAPGNMIGGRMIEIDPALFGRAQANRYFNHFTYPGDTYATYYADVPMVHRNYAAPEATDMLMAKYNQWRKGARKSDPLKPPITVHPFSTDKTGRDTWRKMFEEQRMVQPINDRMLESIQRGEQRRPLYGFNKGGSVEDHALMLVSQQA